MTDYASPLRIIRQSGDKYRVYLDQETCLFGLLKPRTFSECKAFVFGYYLATFTTCTALTEYDF